MRRLGLWRQKCTSVLLYQPFSMAVRHEAEKRTDIQEIKCSRTIVSERWLTRISNETEMCGNRYSLMKRAH